MGKRKAERNCAIVLSKKSSVGKCEGIDVTEEENNRAVRLLRAVDWNKCQNTSRVNVIRKGDHDTPKNSTGREYCHSFIFGKNMKDADGSLSYWSTQYPELYAFFQTLIERVKPNHKYTNITVNKNLKCKMHTDRGNIGPSYIVGFGDYSGGRLYVEELDEEKETSASSTSKNHKDGSSTTFQWKEDQANDLFRSFVRFEGSKQAHETEAFKGAVHCIYATYNHM